MAVTHYWFEANKVIIGETTLLLEAPIFFTKKSLSSAKHPFDALRYAKGSLLYKGEIFDDEIRQNTYSKAIAMIDSENLLRRFAKDQALSVIHLWDAPQIVIDYLNSDSEEASNTAMEMSWFDPEATAIVRDAAWASRKAANKLAYLAAEHATKAACDAARVTTIEARKEFLGRIERAF